MIEKAAEIRSLLKLRQKRKEHEKRPEGQLFRSPVVTMSMGMNLKENIECLGLLID